MDKQICDPSIPYMGSIYGGSFSPGKVIRIQGFVPGIAYRFAINLQCGCATVPSSDVAMQISVRLLDNYISLNSLQNGVWGEEQRSILAIKQKEKFEIIVTCDFNQYKVAINGQHYCQLPQRIHYDHVTHLAIDGDVSIIQISYESALGVGSGPTAASTLNGASQVPVPTEVPLLLENGGPGFETTNTATRVQNFETKHFSPSSEFSELPSYEAALGASSRPPYATNNPKGLPNATGVPGTMGASAYPQQVGVPGTMGASPYPQQVGVPGTTGASPYPQQVGVPGTMGAYAYPQQVGVPGTMGAYAYPQQVGAPGMAPPPPGLYNVPPARRYSTKKKCLIGWGIVFGFLFVIAIKSIIFVLNQH